MEHQRAGQGGEGVGDQAPARGAGFAVAARPARSHGRSCGWRERRIAHPGGPFAVGPAVGDPGVAAQLDQGVLFTGVGAHRPALAGAGTTRVNSAQITMPKPPRNGRSTTARVPHAVARRSMRNRPRPRSASSHSWGYGARGPGTADGRGRAPGAVVDDRHVHGRGGGHRQGADDPAVGLTGARVVAGVGEHLARAQHHVLGPVGDGSLQEGEVGAQVRADPGGLDEVAGVDAGGPAATSGGSS